MSASRRHRERAAPCPPTGTVFEVCAVCPPGTQGPLGGPGLRAVGTALVNPDRTITAWLAAQPQSGVLLLRPGSSEALLPRDPRPLAADDLEGVAPAGQA